VSQLQSIFGIITEHVVETQKVIDKLKEFASVHPIAQAAIVAVLIPYQLLKNEHMFIGRFRDLFDKMRTLLKELSVVKGEAKFQLATDAIKSLMKTSLEFSNYVKNFMSANRFKRFAKAQVDIKKLDGFAESFDDYGVAFQRAILYQVAGDVNILLGIENKKEVRRRLDPVRPGPDRDPCMEGTRVNILERINNWIDEKDDPSQERNSNGSNAFEGNVSDADLAGGNHGEAGSTDAHAKHAQMTNIFWLSGAPGAGKYAISTSIVRRLESSKRCAKFFIDGQSKDSGILARSGVPLRPNSLIHILATRSHFTTS